MIRVPENFRIAGYRKALGLVVWSFAVLTWSAEAVCQSPELTRLFPLGGMRGTTVDVQLVGKFPDTALSFWMDSPGLRWEPQAVEGKKDLYKVTIDPTAEPGVRFFRAYDEKGASKLHRFVVGTIREVIEVEPNDTPKQAQPIELDPILVNGVLQVRNDVDLFSVKVKANTVLVASVDAERDLASPLDACLQIVDHRGIVLAQNLDSHGLDPVIAWPVKADGEVFVRVYGYPASPDSTISFAGGEDYGYRLTLTAGPYVSATMPMAVTAGGEIQCQLFGFNLPLDATSKMFAAEGASSVAWSAATPVGRLVLPVTPHALLLEPEYRQRGTEGDLASTIPPSVVATPVVISGQVASTHETDAYRISAKKDESWRIRVDSRRLGYELDSVLTIHDASGKQLQRTDDVGSEVDPVLVWKAPAEGEYEIRVFDLHGRGDPSFFYRLWIEPDKPELTMRVDSDLYTGKVGEVLELAVSIDRRSGFAEAVKLKVLGLPESIVCEPVTSEVEGETAKTVKFKLDSKSAWNGPVRIESDPPMHRVVTTKTALEEIWLTIQAP